MPNVLITGFTPFDGRAINGSWVAAQLLARRYDLRSVEIPVVWGAPRKILEPICDADCPEMIISMGEGREGWFDIETVARNERKERADNEGRLPAGAPVEARGPDRLDATIEAKQLQEPLVSTGFPIRISSDAGAFLCEELLYTLERLKLRHEKLRRVAFIHLPPFDTPVTINSITEPCTEAVLTAFTSALFERFMSLDCLNGAEILQA